MQIVFYNLQACGLQWFIYMPLRVIISFVELMFIFLTQFVSTKPSEKFTCSIADSTKSDKMLWSFITLFQKEMLEVGDLELTVAQTTLTMVYVKAHSIMLVKVLEFGNSHIDAKEYSCETSLLKRGAGPHIRRKFFSRLHKKEVVPLPNSLPTEKRDVCI